MTDEERKSIFSRNLSKYVSQSGLTQKEIADRINVSPQTFNTWMQGIALPRMGKIQLLADFFHIGKTDLIDEKTNNDKVEEIQQLAYVIAENPLLTEILILASKATPTDLEVVLGMLRRFTSYQTKLSDMKLNKLSDYKD